MDIQHRHLCLIYAGAPAAQLPIIIPEFLQNFAKKRRCLFLGSPSMILTLRSALKLAGLDVDEESRNGSIILSSDQSHLKEGRFDSEMMLEMLKKAVDQALADGFTGLWATGDMSWEFGAENNLDKLLKYECGLEKVFRTTPALSGICQYSKDTLPLHILGDGLLTHPSLYINHTLHRTNEFYTPPEILLVHKPAIDTEATIDMLTYLETASSNPL